MTIGPTTWIVAQSSTVTRNSKGDVNLERLGLITMVDMEARDSIPLFTTQENADAYIKSTNEVGKAAALPVRNLGILADFLEQLLDVDFAELIVLDPEGKTGGKPSRSLKDFVADLRLEMKPR